MKFNKIVRDNVLSIIKEHKRKFTYKEVNNYEAIRYLVKKIHEETDELEEVLDIEEKATEEIGDIFECLYAIINKMSISLKRIDFVRNNKAIKNGKFDKNIVLLWIEGKKF